MLVRSWRIFYNDTEKRKQKYEKMKYEKAGRSIQMKTDGRQRGTKNKSVIYKL